YRALHPGNPDHLAEIVNVLDDDEEAIDHVMNKSLRAEADRQADDAGTGEERLHVHAEDGKNLQQSEEVNDERADALDYRGQGAQLSRTKTAGQFVPLAEFVQFRREKSQQAGENGGDNQDY